MKWKRRPPKYVSVTRLRKVHHREELEDWVEHYERLPLLKFDKLYVRKGLKNGQAGTAMEINKIHEAIHARPARVIDSS